MTHIKTLFLFTMLLSYKGPVAAAPVPVRFPEGIIHGFLLLKNAGGAVIASGDLLQSARKGEVDSRMVFRFKDGSVFEEKVVFTQKQTFTMQSYRQVKKGPAFTEDTEISLERATGKYRVKTRKHKDGEEKVLEGTQDLPPDLYIGKIGR